MKVVSANSPKGGTGKSTSVANLSCAMGEKGHRVLAVDLEGSANLSEMLGFDPPAGRTVGTLLTNGVTDYDDVADVIARDVAPGVDLLPSRIQEESHEVTLGSQPGVGIIALRKLLAVLQGDYDVALIDTPPRLETYAANAVIASDGVIGVVAPEALPLYGARLLMKFVDSIRDGGLNPGVTFLGILLNAYDPRWAQSTHVFNAIAEEGLPRFETVIRRSAYISNAVWQRTPAVVAFPHTKAADSYRALATEVAERLGLPSLEVAHDG